MMHADDRWNRPLAAVADNWASRGYLLVFAALMVWVVLDALLVAHPDASFAGIWPLLLTLPTSLLLLALPSTDGWIFLAGLVVAALVNAVLLGLLVRALTSRSRGGSRS